MIESKKKAGMDPEKEYGLMELQAAGFFPWAKNTRTLVKIIENDRNGENMLRAKVTGEGRLRRYRVKGKHVKKFLEKYGPGMSIRANKK
jgi:hypothetical protein